jgi:hypothetical protein
VGPEIDGVVRWLHHEVRLDLGHSKTSLLAECFMAEIFGKRAGGINTRDSISRVLLPPQLKQFRMRRHPAIRDFGYSSRLLGSRLSYFESGKKGRRNRNPPVIHPPHKLDSGA